MFRPHARHSRVPGAFSSSLMRYRAAVFFLAFDFIALLFAPFSCASPNASCGDDAL